MQGFRVVPGRDCWHKSLTPLMVEVREQMGDGPVYLSFDIDALDPSVAPGTGTTIRLIASCRRLIFQTRLALVMYRWCAISVKEHSDKKPLEL